ncbi:MAG: hypothetical protein ABSG43_30955 [Solirubrobacteraceae bacterium]|jgi:hypothetical protein
MITRKHLAAALGFAFVAAWIRFGFGDAILCLLGAAICYAVVSFLEGDLDLTDLQGRLGRDSATNPTSSPPRPRARPRVQ